MIKPENAMYRCTQCKRLFLLHSIADSGRCRICIEGEQSIQEFDKDAELERLKNEIEALRKQVTT